MKKIDILFLMSIFALLLMTNACNKDDDDDMMDDDMVTDTTDMDNDTMPMGNPNATVWRFEVDDYSQEAVQEALILMDEEDTISFGTGTFEFTSTLSLDDKDQVVIMGEGLEETILDFTNQTAGAEGLKVTATNTILAHFTIQNPIGDAIKAKDCQHINFWHVGTVWTGEASEDNGAYGLYPVSSQHVLIDGCKAVGASDAGIYVGQCENVIVRNSWAENNVAGIEIENTKHADVYDNTATNNTGGILVFDLQNLPTGQGEFCRIFNNDLIENNYRNFAPEGNIVGQVPPGTGIMAMACKNVEIFENNITNNNVMGLGLVNYEVLAFLGSGSLVDSTYIPYPRNVYVHSNNFTRTNDCPEDLNQIGSILTFMFDDCMMPDILYDGVMKQEDLGDDEKICIGDNGGATFADLYLEEYPLNQSLIEIDPPSFMCEGTILPAVEVNVPLLSE